MRNNTLFSESNTRFRGRWKPLVLALVIALDITLTCGSQAQTFNTLYSFQGGTDGYLPASGLISDPASNLYGVTFRGGDSNCDHGVALFSRLKRVAKRQYCTVSPDEPTERIPPDHWSETRQVICTALRFMVVFPVAA